MVDHNSSGMNGARFAEIIAAYGGDPKRWPAVERDPALSWLASNPTAQALLVPELRLDQALGAADASGPSAFLESRLLHDFEQATRRRSWRELPRAAAESVWPGAPVWAPACAFALALTVGICVAVLVPLDGIQTDDVSGGSFALEAAPDFDAGQGV